MMTPTKTKQKVLLTALRDNSTLSAGVVLARQFAPRNFEIAELTASPDIVLYLEYGYVGLSDLPSLLNRAKKFPLARHFVFSECDWPFPVFPGAYPSLYKECAWANSWSYLPRTNYDENGEPRCVGEPEYLFSFLGRINTHPVRREIIGLNSNRSPCIDLAEAPKRLNDFQYTESFRKLLLNSKFVLCPRGFGAASIRLFEAMSCGRVPVIISDQWRRPPGISWEEFCIFVPEREVRHIPAIISNLESDALKMGQRALENYNRFFAPNVFFERLLGLLLSRYSECDFGFGGSLLRAWRALGWREIKTVGSQAKALMTRSVFKE